MAKRLSFLTMNNLLVIISLLISLSAADVTNNRLPRSVRPLSYNLKVLTKFETPPTFEGEVCIRFVALVNTDNVTLHAVNLKISDSTIQIVEVKSKKKISVNPELRYDQYFLVVTLNEPLAPPNQYDLCMTFSQELFDKSQGYFLVNQTDRTTKKTSLFSVTQFQPTFARTAFPCFDEPDLKAKFTITLGYHKNYNAYSNMPPNKIIAHADLEDYLWCEFKESVSMSTYLVAYSVNDLPHTTAVRTKSGVEIRSFALPAVISSVGYATDIALQVLELYETLLGINYSLPKLEQIAVPTLSGAMENWGLVTYQQSSIVYTAKAGLQAEISVANIVAHEITHQWFGNLVTCEWWSDVWLNEGVATYMGGWILQHVVPELKIFEQETLSYLIVMFQLDAFNDSKAISHNVAQSNEIIEIFDETSYKKGSLVIRMLHNSLSNSSFFEGIQNYLKKYAYGNVNGQDLWNSISDTAKKDESFSVNHDLIAIMESWMTQPGYPVININRNLTSGALSISQERFLFNEQSPDAAKSCWWIPLSYTTSKSPDFSKTQPNNWLGCPLKLLTLNLELTQNEWVIFNLQMTGYYKVNYDLHSWNALIDVLNSEDYHRIHELNRAQLVEDSLQLAWNCQLDYSIALRLIEYLKRETTYEPWIMALSNLKKLKDIIKGRSSYGDFKWYVQGITKPIYIELGRLDDNFKNLTTLQGMLKTQIASWACYFNVDNCVSKSKEIFAQWQQEVDPDESNPIPINLRKVVYCVAIRENPDEDWIFLWLRYSNSKDAHDRATILSSLACTRSTWLMNVLFEKLFFNDGSIPLADVYSAIEDVNTQDVGFHIVRAYVIENIGTFLKSVEKAHPGVLSGLLKNLVSKITSMSNKVILINVMEAYKAELTDIGIWNEIKDVVVNQISLKEDATSIGKRMTNAIKQLSYYEKPKY